MTNLANVAVTDRRLALARPVGLVIGASLFIAVCSRLSIPLPFTPVPLTLANFAVLAVGLVLGSRRGFAAATTFLAMGAVGLPVFSPAGPGGTLQLFGVTGGYLMAYPLVAYVAGLAAERDGFWLKLAATTVAEVLLFACGVSWFMLSTHSSVSQAISFALFPFVFFEGMKIMGAAGLATRFHLK